jgi:cytochrome c biogenesis protein CcmG/thiol:disulfide interchange protein DsbE
MNLRRRLLLPAGALALVGAVWPINDLTALKREAPLPAQSGQLPGASTPPVIRFVKDPEIAPPFQARDLSGISISTADWNGKVVLLNFWATWCPPCRLEIPELIALQAKYGDRLQIVGISDDEDPPEMVLRFAREVRINYPIVMNNTALTESYPGVTGLPTTFVIDTHGRVVQRHTGLYPLEAYEREVRALLGLPVNANIETFVDIGQVLLKNAANATTLPGVEFGDLTAEQKKRALHRLNAESCTCGCSLTLAQCRINDSSCPISLKIAKQVVKDVATSATPESASPSKSGNSNSR